MHFLMVIVHDPERDPADAAGAPDADAWFEYARSRGEYALGIRADDAAAAVTLTVRGGEDVVEPGPFTDGPAHLAGVALLECDTLEDALDLARRNPAAHDGRVEIRPVHSFGGPLLGADEQGVDRERRRQAHRGA